MQQSVTLSFLLLLVVHSSSSATSLLLVTVEAVNNKGPSTVHCGRYLSSPSSYHFGKLVASSKSLRIVWIRVTGGRRKAETT